MARLDELDGAWVVVVVEVDPDEVLLDEDEDEDEDEEPVLLRDPRSPLVDAESELFRPALAPLDVPGISWDMATPMTAHAATAPPATARPRRRDRTRPARPSPTRARRFE